MGISFFGLYGIEKFIAMLPAEKFTKSYTRSCRLVLRIKSISLELRLCGIDVPAIMHIKKG